MKKLLFMLLLGLFSLVGLKPAEARLSPTVHPRHLTDSVLVATMPTDSVAVVGVTVRMDTATVISTPALLTRPVAAPEELAPAPGWPRYFKPRRKDGPIDSLQVRRWRNQLQRPTEVRASCSPLHLDPGRIRRVG